MVKRGLQPIATHQGEKLKIDETPEINGKIKPWYGIYIYPCYPEPKVFLCKCIDFKKMPNYSWGPVPKKRAKFLLEKLLDSYESENPKVKCRWDGEEKVKDKQSGQDITYYKFSVETTFNDLLNFINNCLEGEKWNTGKLRNAIDQIEIVIMGEKEKQKTSRKGQTTWELKLNLWYNQSEQEKNVERFCEEWDKKSPSINSEVKQVISVIHVKQSIHHKLIELLDTELDRNNDLSIKIIKLSREHFSAQLENRQINTPWGRIDRQNNNSLIKFTELLRMHYLPQLENMLRNRNWEEADRITCEIIWELAGTSEERSFRAEVSKNFSCEDLRTIDALWTRYSDGYYGFSVQSSIWQSSKVNRDINKFMSDVGWTGWWREDGKDVFGFVPVYSFSDDDLKRGQLPWLVTWENSDGIRDRTAYLSRIESCGM